MELNVQAKIIRQHGGGGLHDIGFGNDFLTMTPKAQKTKGKHRQMELYQN